MPACLSMGTSWQIGRFEAMLFVALVLATLVAFRLALRGVSLVSIELRPEQAVSLPQSLFG